MGHSFEKSFNDFSFTFSIQPKLLMVIKVIKCNYVNVFYLLLLVIFFKISTPASKLPLKSEEK